MLDFIKDTVRKAGKRLLIRYLELLEGKDVGIREKAKSDFVTKVDVEIENYIKELLEPARIPVVGEETAKGSLPEEGFLVDPIDGTRNFMRGNPHFAINIAYFKKGKVLCGVTYDPVKKEMFFAEKGKGAFLNGERIKVSQNRELSKGIVGIGLPYRGKELIEEQTRIYKTLFLNGCATRHTGSAALDLAYVACGRYDGIIYFYLSPWDVASGILFVEEAGGKVEGVMGKRPIEGWLFATNGVIHETLKDILNPCLKGGIG